MGFKIGFKEFYKAWKKRDLLRELFKEAEKALDCDEQMFIRACGALTGREQPEIDIYAKDKEINEATTKIRRKVIVHITLNPKKDPVAFLTLIDISRDVERIGDYTKNIFDLSTIYSQALEDGPCILELEQVNKTVLKMFRLTRSAIEKVDEGGAKEVMERHLESIDPRMDKLIERLIRETPSEPNKSVVCALYARYLKRISAHLMNISSTMTHPYHEVKIK